ncbi:MAG: RiPP maturation radical SAM C-methyltransferase [Betaproteobacteria bacterium]
MNTALSNPRVLLLAMPWNRWDYPSIQVGLLKAYLCAEGIAAQAGYPYVDLARRLGSEGYNKIADKLPPLLAESFFTMGILDGDAHLDAWLAEVVETEELDHEQVLSVVHSVRDFLSELFDSVSWDDVDVVGFTCTFNQVYASIALAQRIKLHHPKVRIVFGGSNFHGKLGRAFLENYQCIDCVISGPGEQALLNYVCNDTSERVYIDGSMYSSITPVIPDYEEYFNCLPADWRSMASLVAIASRGCHYGRCVFCAQNLEPGCYKYPPEWVHTCLNELVRRHGALRVEFADTAFPVSLLDCGDKDMLGKGSLGLFSEFTAGLSEYQYDQISSAGFDIIQVGIESFHSGILRRMRKPADLLTNVQCLKLAAERGINVVYNLILDFPSTTAVDIEEMLRLLELIFHLPPPTSLISFQLQYNAPILKLGDAYGITDIRPHHHYQWLDARFDAGKMVPFYFEFKNKSPIPTYLLEQVHSACERWHEHYNRATTQLNCRSEGDSLLVFDRRGDTDKIHEVKGVAASIINRTSRPILERKLRNEYSSDKSFDYTLNQLIHLGLVLRDSGKLLALPMRLLPTNRPKLNALESYFSPELFSVL